MYNLDIGIDSGNIKSSYRWSQWLWVWKYSNESITSPISMISEWWKQFFVSKGSTALHTQSQLQSTYLCGAYVICSFGDIPPSPNMTSRATVPWCEVTWCGVLQWNCWRFQRSTLKRLVGSSAMLQIQDIHSMLHLRSIYLIYVLVCKDVMSLKYRKVTCDKCDFQLKIKRFFGEITESFSIY